MEVLGSFSIAGVYKELRVGGYQPLHQSQVLLYMNVFSKDILSKKKSRDQGLILVAPPYLLMECIPILVVR